MPTLDTAISLLKESFPKLDRCRVVVGFDGFNDVIQKIIELDEPHNEQKKYISRMKDFGQHILSHSGKSCALVLETQTIRMGGNSPILASALGKLGMGVACIGAMGYPEIQEHFLRAFPKNAKLYSVANPSVSNVLEFEDGKVMMSQLENLDILTWPRVKELAGMDNLIRIFSDANLVGLMNWSEVPNTFELWEGLLDEILPKLPNGREERLLCLDLADCTRKSDAELIKVAEYAARFQQYYKVVLSINENECNRLYRAFYQDEPALQSKLEGLFRRFNTTMLSMHSHTSAMAIDPSGCFEIPIYNVEKPTLLVGAGDHFNAGLLSGLAMGFPTEASLMVANATASYFVRHGESPTRAQLLAYMGEWQAHLDSASADSKSPGWVDMAASHF